MVGQEEVRWSSGRIFEHQVQHTTYIDPVSSATNYKGTIDMLLVNRTRQLLSIPILLYTE